MVDTAFRFLDEHNTLRLLEEWQTGKTILDSGQTANLESLMIDGGFTELLTQKHLIKRITAKRIRGT